ncbi:hypothetical protein [Cytobacillus dafuensis]|uniref:Sodium:proton antiporter n=1 Tax=Cytobacillus dafuensis TaxID=1742359 RepID=A0A5B8Z8L9_CYTDA|nr:hypothetical protein [Cytobacillus dafuensis]QED48633.1 hypothetical protein FSZ17_16025 [Cytobacillus dafuensis]
MGRIFSIILIGLGSYFIFQNRYRALNMIIKNSFLRRIFVSTFMGLPGVRNQLMKMVFPSGPAELH